ncbi:MAG: DUF167 family protein [Beijerinckiaceae bacterium]|nr:DUF167 family protein [Beijerinckiaceae bacterium]
MGERPFRRAHGGLRLDVRLTPRSSTDRVEGLQTLSDGRQVLAARVRAAPESGRANEALLRLLAQELGLPASACKLASGGKGRIKSVSLAGDPDVLEPRIEALCSAAKE